LLVVHIRDSGRGIEKADIDKLFKRFAKLEQTSPGRNNEGIGLGLSICEAIISQNEGYIEV
jgi:K+-sensing histidine kinase KdpD